MMTGKIESGLYPRILVTVVAPTGNSVKKMLIDTGFDYDVAMHYDDADRFDLELIDYIEVEYASGEKDEEIYCRGKIDWFGEVKEVRVILSNDEEPAIGTRLLKGCVMNMNFIDNKLTIDKPLSQ
jgi:predicted aspartyl protease